MVECQAGPLLVMASTPGPCGMSLAGSTHAGHSSTSRHLSAGLVALELKQRSCRKNEVDMKEWKISENAEIP